MKKIYHLSTCDTCKRIIKEIHLPSTFISQDIKAEGLTRNQIEEMKTLAGSYEALFSKRARLYKERDLKNQSLAEEDYKKLLLEHYTFLKRPVVLMADQIFVGNAKKTIEQIKEALAKDE